MLVVGRTGAEVMRRGLMSVADWAYRPGISRKASDNSIRQFAWSVVLDQETVFG